MFEEKIYIERRKKLREKISSGIIFLPGNTESAMNYKANTFRFRQDSNFLYFFGIDLPDVAGVIDLDEGKDIFFANDYEMEDIIWMGPQPTMSELAKKAGITQTTPVNQLKEYLGNALTKGRKIHYLPPYRGETFYWITELLGIQYKDIVNMASISLIMAVTDLRIIKSQEEINEMEKMADVAGEMHTTAMKMARPGISEREIAGVIEGIALSHGAGVSFPVILSQHGEILHNHGHGGILQEGRMIVTDAGAEAITGYASDITRTTPVGGTFSLKQQEIYEIVLEANLKAIEVSQPGVFYKDVHLDASRTIASGLKELGLMKGNVDDAVKEGAHALFFVHGLGHLLGLDVHDLEGFGENNIGYDKFVRRSDQFGTAYLRFGRELKPGMVVTDEPGIYFIPSLIDLWQKEGKFKEFINYDKVQEYRDFGGIRIEDDILITESGCRVLGKPIPKTVSEVESTVKS